jgi:hypothetical protein
MHDSTPPAEDEESGNSSYSEATDEDNVVIESVEDDVLIEADDGNDKMIED